MYSVSIHLKTDPKFSDRQAWANSIDPEEQSDQSAHCLPFRLHHLDSFLYGRHIVKTSGYRNDPKFSDRGAVWSGSTLFAIPSALFGLITLW